MAKLGVVVGSIRPDNMSSKVAKWVVDSARSHYGEVEEINLSEYPLPLFAEPLPPLANQSREVGADVQKWLDAVSGADALVFVTPEYNHSVPGVLKNAIDHFDKQVMGKQIGIVSHGVVGGARAAEHLRQILESNIGGRVVPETVSIQSRDAIRDDGTLAEGDEQLARGLESVLVAVKN